MTLKTLTHAPTSAIFKQISFDKLDGMPNCLWETLTDGPDMLLGSDP